ncbi:conserved Plasmodium protein, unknown function [Plasmodium berghei]|uniref:Uncharacterized protein n=2 Tax=Plasmodium berghei TaxID=5821 RepID=A0A509AQ15_PLABA|nr:conserved protein, unknown function [Plasmodium berghei ANKA]CXI97761.1 conserved Plasmodium protein, unknown function [Plasmodium berghei]SCL97586.1 conserved Plasmodium protein, unknown function [Plasmodium berghei]SCM16640.1 conserved Plasmodium protein, unknown function [Plasmodium berghei]SCM18437.1 conserved Plasmodium protein, unknown function [Plasmodium berghei]SCN27868.1 conserved Plasmodium protein, unknown function [Plasmodium berghei]|eukprot:XP_034423522.1 conserved protein, unknown function [Plasmodium berghei ANKA]
MSTNGSTVNDLYINKVNNEEKIINRQSSSLAENIMKCNDDQLKVACSKNKKDHKISRIETFSHKYYEREHIKIRKDYYTIKSDATVTSMNSNINRENCANQGTSDEWVNDHENNNTVSNHDYNNKIEYGDTIHYSSISSEAINNTFSDIDEDIYNDNNNEKENEMHSTKIDCILNQTKENEDKNIIKFTEENNLCNNTTINKTCSNIDEQSIQNTEPDNGVTKKGDDSEGESWIEIGKSFNFWDALTNNFKNIFLPKREDANIDGNVSDKNDKEVKETEIYKKVKKNLNKVDKINEVDKMNEICTNKGNHRNGNSFPLSTDSYVKCLNYLTLEKILEFELINKLTSNVINNRINVFTYIKRLNLDEKWAKLPIYKRQYYLHQMKNVKHLNTSDKIYSPNGIYIHEVAAIIFQNVSNLKTLELLSPEYFMSDNTPIHEPFALCPCVFAKLEKLTIIGCQTLEWLHIFRNCSFPLLKKFEVCYYPLHHDHWTWKFVFDFTALGLKGLYNILYTMENLQKLTIGFDVLFDNIDGYIFNPLESHRNILQENNIPNNNIRYSNTLSVPVANGNPSRKYKSYRGKLCEEDFSDIFTIAYYVSGKSGKLKRVMIKYRDSNDKYDDDYAENEDTINEIISEATNTASSYYNYVFNWFRSSDDSTSRNSIN